MKKVLKIAGITVSILLILLIAIPFLFQSKIEDILKNYINKNLNAKVEFSDVSLSFISSFPKAQLSVSDLSITTFEPFKDETLLTSKAIKLTLPIKEVFKSSGDEPLTINSIHVDEALVTLKTDKFGNVNYDIAKKDSTATESSEDSSSFTFDIQDYKLTNSALTYIDEGSNTAIHISEFNHNGNGTFSAETSELDTHTEANVSFESDSTRYLNNNHIKLDALIGLDLENSVYTFKDNKGFINQLPLEFKGFVKLLDNGQEVDITFENPESSFKNFLAIVPEAYAKNLDNVETSGDFKVKGIVKGMVTEETIPTIDISIASNNASFKYPDLPKRVENIVINTSIKNETGKTEDTYVDIKTLNFKIDQDAFKSSMVLKNLTTNMLVNANIDGTLNLGNIKKVYPVTLENELSGILKGNLQTAFDMKALETNAYERIKTSGDVSISDFIFSSEDIVNPIHISTAAIKFNPETVNLNSFKAQTGDSDLNATGTLKNLIGFLLSDSKLQGNFNLTSNNFAVSDFMVADETAEAENKTTEASESLKIPDFLDCTINAQVANVKYDNLNLKNVSGTLLIKDQQATLKDFKSDIFDGKLALNGMVSTQEKTPTFNLNLGADQFNIAQSFKDLELFQNLAPIATLLQGKLNSNIELSGNLNESFSPQLSSVRGNALVELLTSVIQPKNDKLVNKLQESFSFIDFSKLDLKDIKTALDFSEGKVNVKPFNLKYQDIDIQVNGSHAFDQTMAYNVTLQVPAKYLGSEVNRLIGKINDNEVNKISIPVTAQLGGTFTNPTIKTDLTSGVKNLTTQLIEIEKQKLLNTGKDKIKDLLGGITGGNQAQNTPAQDSTSTQTQQTPQQPGNVVKDVIGNIFNKKKKAKDSVN